MADLDKCPWCGAEAFWTDPNAGFSGYAAWQCGSMKNGEEPIRSQQCEINTLEAEVERLTADRSEARKAAIELHQAFVVDELEEDQTDHWLQRWPWLATEEHDGN